VTHLGTSKHVNGGQCDIRLWEKDYQILVKVFSPTCSASTQISKYVSEPS